MESLERIESLGERAAKVMFELCSTIIGRNWLILVNIGRVWLELHWIGIEISIDIGKEKAPICFDICIGIEIRN